MEKNKNKKYQKMVVTSSYILLTKTPDSLNNIAGGGSILIVASCAELRFIRQFSEFV